MMKGEAAAVATAVLDLNVLAQAIRHPLSVPIETPAKRGGDVSRMKASPTEKRSPYEDPEKTHSLWRIPTAAVR